MNYIEVILTIDPLIPAREILIAELAEVGFESFTETEEGCMAYIPEEAFQEEMLDSVMKQYNDAFDITFRFGEIETINWNEVWERNYIPVVVEGRCGIRAPFHPERPDLRYDLVIEPKMSFGTAHHDTTALMITWMLGMTMSGMKVLDMGCGTGVLAILAAMMGATEVTAIDNYIWAYENTLENAARNNVTNITAIHGDAKDLTSIPGRFDVVLANINRNVLWEDMDVYMSKLETKGLLLISGFFTMDEPLLTAKANGLGLRSEGLKTRNDWASVCYIKMNP